MTGFTKLSQIGTKAKEPTLKRRKPDTEKEYKELRAKCVTLFAKCVKKKWEVKDGFYAGRCFCFTCGVCMDKNATDCGHYLSVKHEAVQFDFRNARPQCPTCNRGNYGEPERFRKNLVNQIGIDAVLELEAAKYQIYKHSKETLILKIQELNAYLND